MNTLLKMLLLVAVLFFAGCSSKRVTTPSSGKKTVMSGDRTTTIRIKPGTSKPKYGEEMEEEEIEEEEIIEDIATIDIKKSIGEKVNIALIIPRKSVGRYSMTSIDTILSYLISRGGDFGFEVFDSGDESRDSIEATYSRIESKDYDYVVAILTINGAENIINSGINFKKPIFVPTVNIDQVRHDKVPQNLFFGGIDYKKQISLLLTLSSGNGVVAYNDNNIVGIQLESFLLALVPRLKHSETIDNQAAATFGKKLQSQESVIENSTLFLNTPVVKSGLILSQLSFSKKRPEVILSTQINYNPSIFILTQNNARDRLYVANAIGDSDERLVEVNSLFSGNIKHDWVNYATALGIEMAYLSQNPNMDKFFEEKIIDHQIEYKNRIYKAGESNFILIRP